MAAPRIFHQPGWASLPIEEFQRLVAEQTSEDGWVIDGNYSAVQPIVWARADTVVWLDLPRRNRDAAGRLHLTFVHLTSREEITRFVADPLHYGRRSGWPCQCRLLVSGLPATAGLRRD